MDDGWMIIFVLLDDDRMIFVLLMGPSVLDDGGTMMTISADTGTLFPKKLRWRLG